jgi:hypothetical protein
MTKTLLGFVVCCGLAACSSDSPPGASVVLEVTLPDSPLARTPGATLLRAGDAFTLAGYDNGTVRWGRLSMAGILSNEASFALSPPVVGPVFAATKKNVPGDQLVVLSIANSATTPGNYDLTAITHAVGNAAPSAPVILASLPTGTDPKLVKIAAGAALSGNLGFVVWGTRVEGVKIQYLLLDADAVPRGEPGTALDKDGSLGELPNWDCLAAAPGMTGIGFSVLYPTQDPTKTDWRVAQIDEAGGVTDMSYGLLTVPIDCRIVGSPTSVGGYNIAFRNNSGIGFATYDPPLSPTQPGNVTTYEVAMSPQSFGDPLHQPIPAWVAAAGNDISIGLDRLGGPLVARFTYDAIPHGARLSLRTQNGQTGPVAAQVSDDIVYVTYTDQVSSSGGASSTVRYFAKIQSPAKLP